MAKRKIDNLTEASTASEMEQAILEAQEQANQVAKPEEVIEAPKNEEVLEEAGKPKETPKEEPKPEPNKEKEVVEDEFGGDYKKLYKSYKESYGWNTRLAQDVAEMKREIEATKASAVQKQPEPQMTQEQFDEWYQRDPITATRWLAKVEAAEMNKTLEAELKGVKQNLGGFLAQATLSKFRTQYSDFSDLETEIADQVRKLPSSVTENPQFYDTVLETTYWAAKGRKLKEAEQKAREEGRKEAQDAARAKKEAYVEGSTKLSVEQPLNMDAMTSDQIFEILKARGAVRSG